MAIKILNTNPSPNVAKECICSNCGVTLQYVPADTREENRTDYTGSTDCYRVLNCPKCDHKITVGHC